MSIIRFSRTALQQAVRDAAQGAYVADAAVSRPWLRLLGLIPLTAVLAFVAAVFVGGGMTVMGVDPTAFADRIPDGPTRLDGEVVFVALLAASLLIIALAVLIAAMIVYRRPAAAFLWPRRRFSLRLLVIGFAVMAGLCLLIWPLSEWLEPMKTLPPLFDPAWSIQTRINYAAATAVFLLIAAAAEEIAFRAVLLKVMAGLTQKIWLLCLLNALLFAVIHLDPNPTAFVARAMMGFIWTWAALRLGGIEFAIGAHWANNLFIAWLAEPMSSAALPGQTLPPYVLAIEALICVVVFIFIERIARNRGSIAHAPVMNA